MIHAACQRHCVSSLASPFTPGARSANASAWTIRRKSCPLALFFVAPPLGATPHGKPHSFLHSPPAAGSHDEKHDPAEGSPFRTRPKGENCPQKGWRSWKSLPRGSRVRSALSVVVPVSVLTPVTSARASAHIGLPHASGPELAEKNREVASMR